MLRKLPIGLQHFESLRHDGYLYVDKTAYVYKLVHEGKPYFLSRPRRFGKSLLVSTLRAYWEGKRDVFEGLAIERLEEVNEDAWRPHPVFLFDFNGASYQSTPLESVIDVMLQGWEGQYGGQHQDWDLGSRFEWLLATAHERTGQRCVVLVDEYDKPLLEVMDDQGMLDHNRSVFKGFFSALKKCDEDLRFVFITGVTKFSKVSIFSDLNQLRDISFSREYACICGVTEQELVDSFGRDLDEMTLERDISRDDCLERLRESYDGYHFHPQAPGIYNPFSLLNAFANRDFGAYWFESGTPTFLIRRLQATGFDPRLLTDGNLKATEAQLSDYRANDPDVIPLLYQAGYLTIIDFDERRRRYTLAVPNGEVKYGLVESLIPAFAPCAVPGTGTDIWALDDCIEDGNLDGTRDVLAALFASIPYTQKSSPFEHYFQAVIYLVFTLLGRFVQCEMHTATGRVDCVLGTDNYVYLFEFKRDGTTEEALAQIDERGYALPFSADPRRVFKVGATFDSQTRLLSGWEVRE